jgi:Ca-activated chloride channel family protein
MTFGQPDFLYALAAVPAAALFMLWASWRRRFALARLGDAGLIVMLTASVNRRARGLRGWFWLVALALTILAVARPQWGSDVEVVERQGVQLMVALDISKSMLAEDLKPNRLERAKLEISSLMDKLGDDEVGLVLFSGAAFLQFPLTFDYATARTFLQNAEPGMISRPGTDVGGAIDVAIERFDEQSAGQKVILIVTDGESHEGDPVEAAGLAMERGVVVYTLGLGAGEGEPIPEYDEFGRAAGFIRDQQGNVVLSRLDEDTLQRIAHEGGGAYYRSTADGSSIDDLVDDLASLERDAIAHEVETRRIERFQGFLLAALIALVCSELFPDRVASWLQWRDRARGEVSA